MTRRFRWLVIAFVVAVALSGWFGWQQYRWRQAYYADVAGQVTYDVEMAHRSLLAARDSQNDHQKLAAMSEAFGYLVSAQTEAHPLLDRIAPFRKGHVAYMPGIYVPTLLQYARNLTTDLPDAALQKRIDLVGGLETALKAGLTDRVVQPGFAHAVDVPRLKQSLDEYFRAMPQPTPPAVLQFEDEPNVPAVTARRQGTDVAVHVDWARTFHLFPYTSRGCWVLVRPGAGAVVSSDAGPQERMGGGPLSPFTVEDRADILHDLLKQSLPPDWTEGSYAAVRLPEGLPQTLTLRLPGGERPSLLLVTVPGAEAVPVAVQE